MAIGRSQKYSNNEAGLKRFITISDGYMEIVKNAETIPTVEEWCNCLGVTRRSLLNYEKQRPLFEPVVKAYKHQISDIKRNMFYGITSGAKLSEEQKREVIERGVFA